MAVALNLLRSFQHERCWHCMLCRVGCEKAANLMERDAWDEGRGSTRILLLAPRRPLVVTSEQVVQG
jgi:NADH:ubiquinone oxidoreductase subunit F (NADH-binding)